LLRCCRAVATEIELVEFHAKARRRKDLALAAKPLCRQSVPHPQGRKDKQACGLHCLFAPSRLCVKKFS
jgi:hypothetical protein